MALTPIGGDITAQVLNDNFSYLENINVGKNDLPYKNVKDYGAVGDGETDDASAIQQAIDEAAESAFPAVEIPDGVYYIASTISLKSNIYLNMSPNAKIRVDDALDKGIIANGSETASSLLSSSVSQNDATIPVSDISGFSPGDLVMVRDTFKPANNQPQNGELHYIREISGNNIILEEGLFESYSTGRSGEVVKIEPLKNIKISGGIIEGGGGVAEQQAAIDFLYVVNVVIEYVVIKNFHYRGVKLRSCLSNYIFRCRFEDITSDTLGYAIKLGNASQNSVVDKNTFIRCGKAFDIGGLSSEFGTVRFAWVQNNWIYGAFRNAISTHEGGEYIYIIDNDCFCRRNTAGIWTRTVNTEIVRNRIWNSQEDGITAENRGASGYLIVKDNVITDTLRDGIRVDNYVHTTNNRNGSYSEVIVEGNQITGVPERGINIRNRHGVNSSGEAFENISVQNNVVKLTPVGLDAIMIRATNGDIRDVILTGNRVLSSYESIGRNGIIVRGDSSYTVYNALITGNHARGGTGIRADGNNQGHWVSGNIAESSINNFDPEDVGENKVI